MEPTFRFCTSADGARISYAVYGSSPPFLYTRAFWVSIDAQFALCDGAQSLTFDAFGSVMAHAAKVAAAVGKRMERETVAAR